MKKDIYDLRKEKRSLNGTIYHDFVNDLNQNSIYKSIKIVSVKDGTAYYECEPYDESYRCNSEEQFFDTCEKIERAFKRFYKKVFEKYRVDNISVDIYDHYSCNAGLSVLENGKIITSNF